MGSNTPTRSDKGVKRPPAGISVLGPENSLTKTSDCDDVVLDEMRRRYEFQQRENGVLDTKGGLVLAFLAGLGILNVQFCQDVALHWRKGELAVIALSAIVFVLYFAAILASIISLRARVFYAPVAAEPSEIDRLRALHRADALAQVIGLYSNCILKNIPTLRSRTRSLYRAVALAVMCTSLLIVTALVVYMKP